MKSIAIIGTRFPDIQQVALVKLILDTLKYDSDVIVRTGGAVGIDLVAMQNSTPERLHVFLPWKGYNYHFIPLGAKQVVFDVNRHSLWSDSVSRFHPRPQALTTGPFKLHARNYGILGHEIKADAVVACPNETGEGGTGQGIRIARHLNIPLFQYNKGKSIDLVTEYNRIIQLF